MKASVMLLIPTLLVMRSRRRSDDVSPYLMVSCGRVLVRKFPERLLTAWAYLI